MMIAYRLRLAAVPDHGRCLILDLDQWQQEALENFAGSLLTDRQRQALEEAQIRQQGQVLAEEIAQELSS